jgi:hypothetical protein
MLAFKTLGDLAGKHGNSSADTLGSFNGFAT